MGDQEPVAFWSSQCVLQVFEFYSEAVPGTWKCSFPTKANKFIHTNWAGMSLWLPKVSDPVV